MSDQSGRTPLHWAAKQGNHKVVLARLRSEACVNPSSHRKATPIMGVASRGQGDIVRMLAHDCAGESYCWPLKRHRHGIEKWINTALHCSAAGGHLGAVRFPTDAGFDREQRDGAGLTPAEISASHSHSSSGVTTNLLQFFPATLEANWSMSV